MNRSSVLTIVLLVSLHLAGTAQTQSSLGHLRSHPSFANDDKLLATRVTTQPVARRGVTVAGEFGNWQNAVTFALSNSSQLSKDLAEFRSSSLITPDINSPNANFKSASYIVLALGSQADIDSYYENHEIGNPGDKQTIQAYIGAIKTAVKSLATPSIAIFATGDVLGAINNQGGANSSSQNVIASGSVGFRAVWTKDILVAKVAVASTQDTIKSNFGGSLLSPAKGASGSFLFEWYRKLDYPRLGKPWLHLYGAFATSLWGVDTSASNPLYRTTNSVSAGCLLNWMLLNSQVAQTPVSLNAEVGFGLRHMDGDVRSLLKGGADSTTFLKAFPTGKSSFVGPEGGVTLSVGDVIASFHAYYFIPRKNESIDGLTRLQFTFGISVNAAVITGLLN